jgi:Mn2+/Fe2+ NRAMP family transporter
MNRLIQILFWSVISAAFIGPGTVTTAASSGAQFGYSLLWALLFSTCACLILQEASVRITVSSGHNLGQAIRRQFRGKISGLGVILLVLGAIILGSAAYEAGNILGGVAGAQLGTGISKNMLTLIIGLFAGLLLYFGSTQTVAKILGLVVALMGIAFLLTAILLKPSLNQIVKGLLCPSFPMGSGLLIMGLIGTTVVPYNLFLASGLAAGQKLSEIRFGLSVAILLGGVISMGVLIVGTAIVGEFNFETLAQTLTSKLGNWAKLFFAFGLFAAGFSSAITAPLAASITTKSLFETGQKTLWNEKSWRYRCTWAGVLVVGILFGLADIRPIPAIIIAQALNGILLPFIAVFLFLVVNDRKLLGKGVNNTFLNICTSCVVIVTILLGMTNLSKAITKIFNMPTPKETTLFFISVVVTLLLTFPIYRMVHARRKE